MSPSSPLSNPAEQAEQARRTRQLRRVALSGLLGTAVEFYDFLVYGTVAALVFGELFFPGADPAVGTIAAFGTFAAGYLARPLGGIVFGHFGDRLGRKSMLLLTMGLMGGASFLIGLLPTYDTIGVWAPVLLITLRVVQGIAIGGEWGGATLMVVEHAGERRRGLWSSFTQMGAPLGSLLSSLVVTMVVAMPREQFAAWGWRVPFLLSVVLLGVGLFVRLKVVESPLFTRVSKDRAQARLPLLEVVRRPRALVLAACVGIGAFTAQSLLTSYLIAYATGIGYPRPQVLTALTVSAVVALVVLPCASALSDRVGRRPVVLAGAVASAVLAFPVLALVDSRSPGLLILAVVLGHGIAQSVMYGPLGALLTEMFGTRVRYTGASLGYQLATLIGAGFSPMIAGSLVAANGGSGTPVSLLICAGAVITAVTVWFVRETHQDSLGEAVVPEGAAKEEVAS
ncbi:MFS transporter [Streptomyces caniscabiei]|uniref:Putative proline/betaine transporter n=1 Tax=Streptomyces caniscabiei TaxID=2746961 RepID=A0A927L9F1_9ACTN|nr:MFS transporter [Streptomyces caniscabiei]MBD9727191.1 MHS family MFS transporter [Streptomyces caniscabiei]MDX3512221.1 MFS transporter [Streptomyces caniscabiei]MDX3721472.1 MFS transporter [Streptomyces caniscabiei]WEO26447.1 MFS transporter [Streptomyces caniscabiei]